MSIIAPSRRLSSRTVRPAVIRATPATFGAGIFPATAPADSWSARFDAAQARYRQSRKPVALVIEPDPLPMLASPIDGVGDMQDPAFYETYQWSPELSKRRCAVVAASVAQTVAEMDAADAADEQARLDATLARFEADAEQLNHEYEVVHGFSDELLAAVAPGPRSKSYPSASDHAWELGYSLGRDGVAAASLHHTHAETMAFLAGHDRGLDAYHDDRRDEVEAVIAAWETDHDVEECELAYAGSAVGH